MARTNLSCFVLLLAASLLSGGIVAGCRAVDARSDLLPAPPTERAVDDPPLTRVDANLRAGPGVMYPIVGGTITGQRLAGEWAVAGQSVDGQWLALADGSWILKELVAGAPDDLPVVAAPDLAAAQAPVLTAIAELQSAPDSPFATPIATPAAAPDRAPLGLLTPSP